MVRAQASEAAYSDVPALPLIWAEPQFLSCEVRKASRVGMVGS